MAEEAEKKKKLTFGERLRGAIKKKAEQVTGRRPLDNPDTPEDESSDEYAAKISKAMKKKK